MVGRALRCAPHLLANVPTPNKLSTGNQSDMPGAGDPRLQIRLNQTNSNLNGLNNPSIPEALPQSAIANRSAAQPKIGMREAKIRLKPYLNPRLSQVIITIRL